MKKLSPFARKKIDLRAVADFEIELKNMEQEHLLWLSRNIDIQSNEKTAINPITQLRMVKTEIARREVIKQDKIDEQACKVIAALKTEEIDQFNLRIKELSQEELLDLRKRLWLAYEVNLSCYPVDSHKQSLADASKLSSKDKAKELLSMFGFYTAEQNIVLRQLSAVDDQVKDMKKISRKVNPMRSF